MLKKLSDISIITMGQSPKSKYYNSNKIGIPFLQGRTTFGYKYPYFDTWTSNWNKEAQLNDILFTVRAPVGDINISTDRIAIGRGLAAIRPTSVSYKYLYYLLIATRQKFVISSVGTIYNSINKESLESIEFDIHNKKMQNHIVNTIGSVDDLIENYQKQCERICEILKSSLKRYKDYISISYYEPKIIKSGIEKFDNVKNYLDTSAINGINNILDSELITYNKRPSRANMQPIKDSGWFARMKDSNKILILSDYDSDIIDNSILSTGFLGIEATDKLPLSFLTAIIISDNFKIQRDLNSTGTTMAGINNETFLKLLVPRLLNTEIIEYEKKYLFFVKKLSFAKRKIKLLIKIKQDLLFKYFN